MILIKKYHNRRLYNTQSKKYITLDNIINMSNSNIPFQIIDIRTKLDITRSTLIQIILEKKLLNMDGWSTTEIKNILNILSNNTSEPYKHNLKKAFLGKLDKSETTTSNITTKEELNKSIKNKRLTDLWKSLTHSDRNKHNE